MVSIPPAKKPSHRTKIRPAPAAPPGPAALVLTVADADLSEGKSSVALTFDRDVDISAIDVTAITVGSAATGNLYQGSGANVYAGSLVLVDLVVVDTYSGTDVKLFASADNGIVAADNGVMWEGASGTGLPFP